MAAATGLLTVRPATAEDVAPVASVVETAPGAHSGDSIDDPAIWVHPTDPSLSLVLVNDKLGALDTYDLDGNLVQRLTDSNSFWGNVDVRQGVSLAGRVRDIAAVGHAGGIRIFEIDPQTRLLTQISDGAIGASAEGLCLYRSNIAGQLYAVNITLPGRLRQWALDDADGDGLVDARLVRDLQVGSESEGCVAHDESGALYVSEEDVGVWRYEAEPDGGGIRTAVDRVLPDGHVAADAEGLAMADAGSAGTHLVASAQNVASPGSSYFTVYDGTDRNDYQHSFRVVDGTASDDCDRTDGIAISTQPMGPTFPHGMFVCQDDSNVAPGGDGHQDLKYVPLEAALPPPAEPVNRAPVARMEATCEGLTCTFSATASTDEDGQVSDVAWDLGDGATATGDVATHTYDAPGRHPVVLTVTDGQGSQDTRARLVPTGTGPTAEVSFVGASRSTNTGSSRSFTAPVPEGVVKGDAMIAFFSGSGTGEYAAPAGWQRVGSVVGSTNATTVWSRVADGTEAGTPLTVRVPTSMRGALAVAAYRGTHGTDPITSAASSGQSTWTDQLVTPVVSSARDDGWRLSAWTAKTSSELTLAPPGGESVRARHVGSGSGAVSLAVTDSGGPVPTGPQGGLSATTTPAVSKGTMWTVLLRPAAPAPPPTNRPPVAHFVRTCEELSCTFDASGSTDPDGVVVQREWSFEDGVGGTGVRPTHTFSAPGTYPVTLTVTDDEGAQASETVNVAVPSTPAVDFVAAGTSIATAAARSFAASVPGAVQEGDLLLLVLGASSSTGVSAPPGWALLGQVAAGTATTYLWQRVATASDAGSTVRVDVPTQQRGVLSVLAYRGTSATQPVAAWAGSPRTTYATSHVTPQVGTSLESVARVSLWTVKSSGGTVLAPPAGEQERTAFVGSGSGSVGLLATDPGVPAGPGALGNLVARTETSVSKVTTWTVLLSPTAG